MVMKFILVLTASLLFASVRAAEYRASNSQPALPMKLVIGSKFDPGVVQEIQPILHAALVMLQEFPPAGHEDNVLAWSSNPGVLKGKTFSLMLADKTTPLIAPIVAASSKGGTPSLTLAIANPSEQTADLILVLRVDKIFYDEAGLPRADVFSRLLIALAHQVYGGLQNYLKKSVNEYEVQLLSDQAVVMRETYLASVQFLDLLTKSERFKKLPKALQHEIQGKIPGQWKGLREWQKTPSQVGSEPLCQDLLKVVNPDSDPE